MIWLIPDVTIMGMTHYPSCSGLPLCLLRSKPIWEDEYSWESPPVLPRSSAVDAVHPQLNIMHPGAQTQHPRPKSNLGCLVFIAGTQHKLMTQHVCWASPSGGGGRPPPTLMPKSRPATVVDSRPPRGTSPTEATQQF